MFHLLAGAEVRTGLASPAACGFCLARRGPKDAAFEGGTTSIDLDTGMQEQHGGHQLLNDGPEVSISVKPGAAVLIYRRQP